MSKGLEALERIGNINLGNNPYCAFEHDKLKNCSDEEYNIIKKELKALEIIKKKRVDVFELLSSISNSMYRNPLERYNSYVEGSFNTELTQQEYDLLEDVLEE